MLQWWEALLLGSVQGFTEFLPISSSGHLVLAELLLGVEEVGFSFDIMVHIGTLFAVFAFFGKDLIPLTRLYWKQLVITTLPALVFGLLFKNWIEAIRLDMDIMAISYVWNALILGVASLLLPTTESESSSPVWLRNIGLRIQKTLKIQTREGISSLQAFLIGVFQALAIIPGISRSASTVSAGIVVGLTRERAFSFAFLMSIPAVTAALSLDFLSLVKAGSVSQIDWMSYGLAIVMSAVTGYLALAILRWIIKQGQLWVFAGYCLVVSVLIVLFA